MKATEVLAAAATTASTTSTAATVTFWIIAVISVAAALGMIIAPRAVHSAVMLAVVMLSLAVLYAVAGAPFLAFVQIIVYTGAVLMLFLFVLMIVGISSADSMRETIRGQRLAAAVFAIALLVLLAVVVGHAAIGPAPPAGSGFSTSNVQRLATLIFTRYFFPFEVTSALLITAALGAMVLAHRERTTPKPTQRELARQRISGGHPAPLPGPGVYARHNAADMPALLPDGTPAPLSLNPVMVGRSRGAVRAPGTVPPEVAGPSSPGDGAPGSDAPSPDNGTPGGGTSTRNGRPSAGPPGGESPEPGAGEDGTADPGGDWAPSAHRGGAGGEDKRS